jgi:hypothetical protein
MFISRTRGISPVCGVAACFALAILAASPSVAGPLTFAQYVQVNGAQQQWTVLTAGDLTTASASGTVYFSFAGIPGLPFAGPEIADFTLNATTNQFGNCGTICGPGDSFVQPGYSGTFSFIDASLTPGANLLSGTFAVTGSPSTTGAQFSSSIGSSGGSFNASATVGNLDQLVLTSSYITFEDATQENTSWSLSSLIPNFATALVGGGNHAMPAGTFAASGAGTFSTNSPPAAIIEPASVGLIVVGLFGLVILRRRTPICRA